jgi:ComF family protein
MPSLRHLPKRLLSLLAPGACALCGLALDHGRVCDGCRDDLPWVERACPGCAMPVLVPLADGTLCARCQAEPLPLYRVIAPLEYRFPVDALVKGLKFRHRLWLAPALAELMHPVLAATGLGADALVPVPLHRWRHARRGFNQADELARALGPRTGLRVCRCLQRRRATAPQSGLDAPGRARNLDGAFVARHVSGLAHALLVDDVVTTGVTASAAARALLEAGVPRVSLVAVARAC